MFVGQMVRIVPGDSPKLNPTNLEHGYVAWMACVYDACGYHLEHKLENNFFPRRAPWGGAIASPFEEEEMEYWEGTDCNYKGPPYEM